MSDIFIFPDHKNIKNKMSLNSRLKTKQMIEDCSMKNNEKPWPERCQKTKAQIIHNLEKCLWKSLMIFYFICLQIPWFVIIVVYFFNKTAHNFDTIVQSIYELFTNYTKRITFYDFTPEVRQWIKHFLCCHRLVCTQNLFKCRTNGGKNRDNPYLINDGTNRTFAEDFKCKY